MSPSHLGGSGPPSTAPRRVSPVRSNRPTAVAGLPASPPATRRVSRAERLQAWIGVSLLLGTTSISLYDVYLLASLMGT